MLLLSNPLVLPLVTASSYAKTAVTPSAKSLDYVGQPFPAGDTSRSARRLIDSRHGNKGLELILPTTTHFKCKTA